MSKIIQTPCSACGKLITIEESEKETKNYCNKYCGNVGAFRDKKLQRSIVTTPTRRPRRGCRSCGG